MIVGRCADVVCRDMKPLNLFVYADTISKLARCQNRASETEQLSGQAIALNVVRSLVMNSLIILLLPTDFPFLYEKVLTYSPASV